ncbi:MAG: tetratricopeptide repeat protein [Pseudomonadota bacterium]
MKVIRIMVLSLLLAAHGLTLGGIDEGAAAYNRGDYGTALREWRPLAEQGNAGAQLNLGYMYDNGYGVPQDYRKAVKWYRRAAEQGNDRAQYNLGLMYDGGYGVPQDYVQAHMWYDIADVAVAVSYRDFVAREMTPTQITEAERLAREWLGKHPYADKGVTIVLQTPIPH